jgi:hypothetical protein
MCIHRGLAQGFALGTGPFATDVALCAEAFRLGGKLQPLEVGVLMREFVDGGLLEGELLSLLAQSIVFGGDVLKKLIDRNAQLVCTHVWEIMLQEFVLQECGRNHHARQCASAQ